MARVGPFTLEHALGRGGMGRVFAARHPSGAPVAIKVMTEETCAEPRFVEAFRREAVVVASLSHPSIVSIYDTGTAHGLDGVADGSPWLAMERAHGVLTRRLGRMEWPEARTALLRLAEGIGHAHANGLVHRDIKPDNVLYGIGSDATTLRLADFGLASSSRSGSSGSSGTPGYLPPEQALGEEVGPSGDLYSFAVVAWELCTGLLPWQASDPVMLVGRQLYGKLPPFVPVAPMPAGLEPLLRSLLARDPAARPGHARLVIDALLALDGQAPAQGLRRWRRQDTDALPLVDVGRGLLGIRPIPWAGRLAERDRCWEVLRDTLAGAPHHLRLSGPTGVGRSRILQWLAVEAREQLPGATVVSASGVTLAAALSQVATGPEWEARAVAEWSSGPLPVAVAAAWAEGFGPLVVAVDDADEVPGLGEALERWVTAVSDRAPLLVVSVGEPLPVPGPRRVDLELTPLAPGVMDRLLTGTLALEQESADLLVHRSGGVPGVALELLRVAAIAGALRQGASGHTLVTDALDRLPADSDGRWVAQWEAALVGSEGAQRELATTLALGPLPASTWRALGGSGQTLSALREARLVVGEPLTLRHPALGHALRARLAPAELRRAHAKLLSHTTPGTLERARHLIGSGAAEEALAGLLELGEAAGRSGDLARLDEIVRTAVTARDHAGIDPRDLRSWDLDMLRARNLFLRSRNSEASDLWLDLVARAPTGDRERRVRALSAGSNSLRRQQRLGEARPLMDEALAEVRRGGLSDRLRVQVLVNATFLYDDGGTPARDLWSEAIGLAEAIGEWDPYLQLAIEEHSRRRNLGDLPGAAAWSARCAAVVQRATPPIRARWWISVVNERTTARDFPGATSALEELGVLVAQLRSPQLMGEFQFAGAALAEAQGHHEEAFAAVREAWRWSVRLGSRTLLLDMSLVELLLARGEVAEADVVLQQAAGLVPGRHTIEDVAWTGAVGLRAALVESLDAARSKLAAFDEVVRHSGVAVVQVGHVRAAIVAAIDRRSVGTAG